MNYPVTLDAANLYVEYFGLGDTVQYLYDVDGSRWELWEGTVVGTPTEYNPEYEDVRHLHRPGEVLLFFERKPAPFQLSFINPKDGELRKIACAITE